MDLILRLILLHGAIFKVWSSQAQFDWSNQQLTQVPSIIDDGSRAHNVSILDLSQNQLVVFDNNLTCCEVIEHLDLSNNQLKSVSIIGDGNLLLSKLDLNQNNLTTVPVVSSTIARGILQLVLSNNKLTSLDPSFLSPFTSLNQINLVGNYLTLFPDFLAVGSTLRNIYLNYNFILVVPTTLLDSLTRLRILKLNNNNLDTFPQFNGSGSTLEKLSLQSNQITSIPDADLLGLSSLWYMDISMNEITQFPNISLIGHVLHTLYIWNNLISDIPSEVFIGTGHLATLSVAGNALTTIPDFGPQACRSINHLDLNHNSIGDDVTDIIACLEILNHLDLSNNLLTVAPRTNSTSTLLTLNLAHNRLTSKGLSNLQGSKVINLDLSYNNIASLSHLRNVNTSLEVMNLQGNPLMTLNTEDFDGYYLLKTIDLSITKIQGVPDLSVLLPALELLNIADIPLVCDCSARWLKSGLATSGSAIQLTVSETPCDSPANLALTPWSQVILECPGKNAFILCFFVSK